MRFGFSFSIAALSQLVRPAVLSMRRLANGALEITADGPTVHAARTQSGALVLTVQE